MRKRHFKGDQLKEECFKKMKDLTQASPIEDISETLSIVQTKRRAQVAAKCSLSETLDLSLHTTTIKSTSIEVQDVQVEASGTTQLDFGNNVMRTEGQIPKGEKRKHAPSCKCETPTVETPRCGSGQGCDLGWSNGASGSTSHECAKSWKCAVWWTWQGCLCDGRGDSVDGEKAYRNMGKVVLWVLASKSGAIGATKTKVATLMCESVLNCGLHQMMRSQRHRTTIAGWFQITGITTT